MAVLSLAVDFDRYQNLAEIMSMVSHAATVVAVLGYVGTPVVLALHSKKAVNHEDKSSGYDKSGYAPLLAEEEKVPARYLI